MKYKNCFEDMFESIPDHRKIQLLKFLIKNDVDLLLECGFSKNKINRLNEEVKSILTEQNGGYSEYVKDQDEPIIERSLKK